MSVAPCPFERATLHFLGCLIPCATQSLSYLWAVKSQSQVQILLSQKRKLGRPETGFLQTMDHLCCCCQVHKCSLLCAVCQSCALADERLLATLSNLLCKQSINFVSVQVQVAVAKQAQSGYWQLRMALKSQSGLHHLRRCGLNIFSR